MILATGITVFLKSTGKQTRTTFELIRMDVPEFDFNKERILPGSSRIASDGLSRGIQKLLLARSSIISFHSHHCYHNFSDSLGICGGRVNTRPPRFSMLPPTTPTKSLIVLAEPWYHEWSLYPNHISECAASFLKCNGFDVNL